MTHLSRNLVLNFEMHHKASMSKDVLMMQMLFFFLHRLPSVADLASSTLDGEEPQPPADTHQCKRSADLCLHNIALSCREGTRKLKSPFGLRSTGTFCYRINSRLFAVPLDARAACPVCKMPKSEHPHTETQPALIR